MSLVVNDSCVEPRFTPTSQSDDWIIQQAIVLLENVFSRPGRFLTSHRPQRTTCV